MALRGGKFVGAKLYGMDRFVTNLSSANRVIEQGAADGLAFAAEGVLRVALPLTPIDEDGPHPGLLRSSQFGPIMEREGAFIWAKIGYDAGIAFYGIYVHEILEALHTLPTQAKFLQRAVFESADDIVEFVERGIIGAMARVKTMLSRAA